MSIELVRPSNHLTLCRPLLLPSDPHSSDHFPKGDGAADAYEQPHLAFGALLQSTPHQTNHIFQFPLASVSCLVLIGDNWQKECDRSDASRVGTVSVGRSFFLC